MLDELIDAGADSDEIVEVLEVVAEEEEKKEVHYCLAEVKATQDSMAVLLPDAIEDALEPTVCV